MAATTDWDETDAFICAAKGEPYTQAEWEREIVRLEYALADARRRHATALERGVCLPARFDQAAGRGPTPST